ncbi:rhodanese-like domain-containing protein [Paenibacillus sp. MSJ-34]|uniref:rhodanese-like domain-containing protein n=1 Tax=Paenibacillus sp. MSJ-34 TaxID=2841529 RepID=UPI001C109A96|nr:rhodanese-like domain-containing protein [Paenibacillus sp. MSJ-34]MBU5442376.1 rhodanese-like domain-containing protein [Paenibacillus sp. MSJ-34]
MAILIVLLIMTAIWFIRRIWPVTGVTYVDSVDSVDSNMLQARGNGREDVKIIDVRDAADYETCHLSGAINISIGRLPYVWKKELSPGEPVLIFSDSPYKSKKAARMLKNKGFRQIYALREKKCA